MENWIAVVNLEEDDGELVEEIYENQPDRYRPITRDEIRIVLETLVRLDYEISYYPEDHENGED